MSKPGKIKDWALGGYAVAVSFAQFPKVREDWKKQNPTAQITETFTTLAMVNVEVPDQNNIGRTRTEQTIGIYWAIIFKKPITAEMAQQLKYKQLSIES